MDKHKTKKISDLKIPKFSEIDLSEFDEYESSIDFTNPKEVKKRLVEHFIAGEHDTFFEIVSLYLDHVGKTKVSKEAKIPQRTIYNFIKGEHKTSSENVFKVMKFISAQVIKYAK
ncbi:MAG: hypothetical protein A2X86_09975 [Bdellovibrionales bacterium GWA2_49_15]|nr:MAG: hypothetical protein A2X86_09975 [Bdellovibrionales bacterium GWA2_49_15]HAZ13111.1 hypothetical protein [Bdellovibrionales bacterium]